MKFDIQELPVKPTPGNFERPSVSALHAHRDGSLLCGVMFGSPGLMRIDAHPEKGATAFHDLGLEKDLSGDVLGVVNGLLMSTSGDTAFCTLHKGLLPGVFRGLMGKDISGKKGRDLLAFLHQQDGGMGMAVRHSVVQISGNQLLIRRSKEPGILWDVAHIGDFIFGLMGSSIWREPYLNAEKRETMRGDLLANLSLHRDDVGTFWLLGQGNRLVRMELTDIKAKPTPLKLPGTPESSGFFLSTPSGIDSWLYGSCDDSKTLVRIRRNPVSFEEEMQTVGRFDHRITGLCAVEDPRVAKLVIATEGPEAAEFFGLNLIKPEDAEIIPPVPPLMSLGRCPEVKCVSNLTVYPLNPLSGSTEAPPSLEISTEPAAPALPAGPLPVIWAGEGRIGWGEESAKPPRLVRITDIG